MARTTTILTISIRVFPHVDRSRSSIIDGAASSAFFFVTHARPGFLFWPFIRFSSFQQKCKSARYTHTIPLPWPFAIAIAFAAGKLTFLNGAGFG